jgi:hypothetical protein
MLTGVIKASVRILYSSIRLLLLPLIAILQPLGYKPNRITAIGALTIAAIAAQLLSRHDYRIWLANWTCGVLLWCLFVRWGEEFETGRR